MQAICLLPPNDFCDTTSGSKSSGGSRRAGCGAEDRGAVLRCWTLESSPLVMLLHAHSPWQQDAVQLEHGIFLTPSGG